MNAKRASKVSLEIGRSSKLLINLLEMMKKDGHIDYDAGKTGVSVSIIKLNECRSVKPRYYVGVGDVDKYMRRFLPSRNFGTLVMSTNKGMLSHADAIKENVGGSVVAYFY